MHTAGFYFAATDDQLQKTMHVQNNTAIFKVSRWLGHSSVRVTERRYAGLTDYDADIDAF